MMNIAYFLWIKPLFLNNLFDFIYSNLWDLPVLQFSLAVTPLAGWVWSGITGDQLSFLYYLTQSISQVEQPLQNLIDFYIIAV